MEHENPPRSLLADSLRAHALLFEAPLAPAHGDAAGMRMLVAFLGVGVGAFYALRMVGSKAVFVVALLATFIVAQRFLVREPMAAIGLRPLSRWTRRERLYLLQVVPLAMVAFTIVFRGYLAALLEKHGLAGFLLFSVLTGLLWGMVQELIYRGWLQTELTRRFGLIAGVVLANILFTFGPLHFDYFTGPAGVRWGGLAAIFGIGLLFGVIYARSGNLWIPAVLHGIWPLNMT